MKIKKKNLLLICALFLLGACQNNPSESENGSIDTSYNDNKTLLVSTSKEAFYQYDTISYSDFLVLDKNSQAKIDRFEIYLNGEKLVDKQSRIFSYGKVNLVFRNAEYEDLTFEISVKRSSSFEQGIYVKETPKKQSYKKGEAFDDTGLSVAYYIEYVRQNRESVRDETECLDYEIKIDGTPISSYVFNEEGYARKYAIIEAKSENGESLFTSVPLSQSGKSIDHKIVDPEEKYNWTNEDKKMKVSFKNSKAKGEKAYYTPEEVNLDFNINSLMDREAYSFRQTPSVGEVPLLVVPVVLNGFEEEATEERHGEIEKAFFGKTKESDTVPFASLSSYYYYSSFKKLKFKGEVTPYFNPTKEGYLGYSDPYRFTLDTPCSLAEDALKWAKEKLGISLSDYDSDNDGYVDGVWLIYMENTDNPLTMNVNAFWPFTSASTNPPGSIENPTLNIYAWAGATHLWGNQANQQNVEKYGIDNHVLEHETGHMLGLSDYYSYEAVTSSDNNYSPLGKLDMMDANFGDHNPYSKMLLGWIKPYVVLGDCEIEIPSSQVENSFFLLPYDDKTYKKDEYGRIILNPFDEYLILDYYTYENLYTDEYERNGARFHYFTEPGGRLYHVDARALEKINGSFSLPSDPDDILYSSTPLFRGITNSQAGDRAESNYSPDIKDYFDEIRLIGKDKKIVDAGLNLPTNQVLFQEGESFSLDAYGEQFHYNGKFDNEKDFSTTFTILSL